MNNIVEKIYVGARFDRLVVIEERKTGNKKVKVRCDCGVEKYVWYKCLVGAEIRSCGCLRRTSGMTRKEYMKQYQRKWQLSRREKYFEGKVCAKCESVERLELDHIDPTIKKYEPRALWGMSEANPNRIAELAKCQILCHDCHKEKTKEDRKRLKWGTKKEY